MLDQDVQLIEEAWAVLSCATGGRLWLSHSRIRRHALHKFSRRARRYRKHTSSQNTVNLGVRYYKSSRLETPTMRFVSWLLLTVSQLQWLTSSCSAAETPCFLCGTDKATIQNPGTKIELMMFGGFLATCQSLFNAGRVLTEVCGNQTIQELCGCLAAPSSSPPPTLAPTTLAPRTLVPLSTAPVSAIPTPTLPPSFGIPEPVLSDEETIEPVNPLVRPELKKKKNEKPNDDGKSKSKKVKLVKESSSSNSASSSFSSSSASKSSNSFKSKKKSSQSKKTPKSADKLAKKTSLRKSSMSSKTSKGSGRKRPPKGSQ